MLRFFEGMPSSGTENSSLPKLRTVASAQVKIVDEMTLMLSHSLASPEEPD
jgi:hypothetical protein